MVSKDLPAEVSNMSLDIEQAKEFVRGASKEDRQKFKNWCEEWDFHLDLNPDVGVSE